MVIIRPARLHGCTMLSTAGIALFLPVNISVFRQRLVLGTNVVPTGR